MNRFRLNKYRLFALVLCGGGLSSCGQPAHAESLIRNGDFEAPFQAVTAPINVKAKIEGNVAQGWRDESGWADVSIAYSQDKTQKHGGDSAQRIDVRSINTGGVQFVQEIPMKVGHIYHASAWMKAAANSKATFQLRQSGAPYTSYGSTQLQLTQEWRLVEISARAQGDNNGLLMFIPTEPGTYWIDDTVLEDVTKNGGGQNVPAQKAPAVAAHITNGGFESPYVKVPTSANSKAIIEGEVAQGWQDDSSWADISVAYSRDETQPHGGRATQRMELKAINQGVVQLVQGVPLVAGRIYRVTGYLRSSTNNRLTVQLRQRGGPYNIYGSSIVAIVPSL